MNFLFCQTGHLGQRHPPKCVIAFRHRIFTAAFTGFSMKMGFSCYNVKVIVMSRSLHTLAICGSVHLFEFYNQLFIYLNEHLCL